MKDFSSIVDVLEFRSRKNPEKDAVIFLADGEEKEERLTFAGLYREARRFAAGLQARGVGKGDRVVIMLPTCLDFLSCLFGTMIIGAVPVLVYPPFSWNRLRHYLDTLSAIIGNSESRILVTFSQAKMVLGSVLQKASCLQEVLEAGEIREKADEGTVRVQVPKIERDDLALIQYTSGSTSVPKGVKITYRNIFSNVHYIGEFTGGIPEEEIHCTWVPLYHDMGLISTIFCLYWGFALCLMSPLHFLSKPSRWLRAVSRYRCTYSGGPNFAFELCTRKIQEPEFAGLDLSCWKVAYNGAEPVRKSTLEAFIERFSPCGFDRKSMYPVYGLAEYTSAVCFARERVGPRYLTVEGSSLEPGRGVKIAAVRTENVDCVSLGRPFPGHEIRIVDEQGRSLPELTVGEIAIGGPSLTPGYYKLKEAFESQLLSTKGNSGSLFRTGDLGFLYQQDLYAIGRKKDLIIVRGHNYYPQDIEVIVDDCPYARRGCSAALSVESDDGTESLVIIAENKARSWKERDQLEEKIRSRVAGSLGVHVETVALIPPRTIPKTASGKIRRGTCRALFLRGDLPTSGKFPLWKKALMLIRSGFGYLVFSMRIGFRRFRGALRERKRASISEGQDASLEAKKILATSLSRITGKPVDPDRLAPDSTLEDFALDSMAKINLLLDIEKKLGKKFADEEIAQVDTVGEIIALIERELHRTAKKSA
jgi:acyl-CoA synthetase (AMP-forming)/AMP-acid ligase II/acyl carrier protein